MQENPSPIIRLEHITKRFPGVVALDDINLSVLPAEIHGIIGENGAGKSTLMNILAGELQPDEGTIYLKGERVVISNAFVSHMLGISVVFQELELCPNLTVAENISLWRAAQQHLWARVNRKLFRETAARLLSDLGLEDMDLRQPVNQLSVAKQQLVEIAKAISTEVEVLILDEPNSALTQEESEHLFRIVRQLSDSGVTILYVSHRLEEVLGLADRITVLRDGKLIDTVEARGTTIKNLITQMVGRQLVTAPRQFAATIGTAVLEVSNLTSEGTLAGVSFDVRKGEIVGVAGLPDSHKDELVDCLFGIRSYQGETKIDGQAVHIDSPTAAIRRGMYLVPSDRRGAGALLTMTLQDNIVASNLDSVSKWGFLNKRAMRRTAKRFYEELDIQATGLSQSMAHLSGGNQQKAILARGLATNPSILVLHEPTRGIDVGAKAEIYKILENLVEHGSAILMVSSELPELISQCDRIVVMHAGTITGIFNRDEATEEDILACMMGEATHLEPSPEEAGAQAPVDQNQADMKG